MSRRRERVRWVLSALGCLVAYWVLMVASTGFISAWLALSWPAELGYFDVEANPSLLGVVSFTSELFLLGVMAAWWRHVRRHSSVWDEFRSTTPSLRTRIVALVCLGICIQVLTAVVLTLLLTAFSALDASYEPINQALSNVSTGVMGFLAVGLLGPVSEELAFRGVVFEFLRRATTGRWLRESQLDELHLEGETRPSDLTESMRWRLQLANVLQAFLFALAHLNPVQGCYAFGIGLVLGYVYLRWRDLRLCMLLHVTVNASSALLGLLPSMSAVVALSIACLVAVVPCVRILFRAPRKTA